MKKRAADMWNSDLGIFRKVRTTALGNCFFSALHTSEKLSFKSESNARSKIVQKNSEDFYIFHIYEWYMGGGTMYKDFIEDIARLEKDRTWVNSVDIYMTAVALRVDIVSIIEPFQEIKSETMRPLMDKALLKHVPGVREILKQSRPVQIVVGNVI